MKPSKEDSTELALSGLLDALASILVPLEVTPARLSQIARASFVKASATQARMRSSGRPHLARIAALTGLSRFEVKRLVSANYKVGTASPESAPRSVRVLQAWKTSARYTKGGRPIPLRIVGRYPSLETLCREYSGDIPYRVILNEFHRKNSIKFSANGKKISVLVSDRRSDETKRDLANLEFIASLIGELSRREKILIKRRIRIGAPVSIQESYVQNAIGNRMSEFLENLPQMFVSRKNVRKSRNCVSVYTLVSTIERKQRLRS